MALKHILPTKTYSAQGLYTVCEGLPFKWGLNKWKRIVFSETSGLKFTKGASRFNCAFRLTGQDYLDFIRNEELLKKLPPKRRKKRIS